MKINNIKHKSDIILIEDEKEAFASITLNPNLTWIKFVLTDNQPNGNKKRIPKKAFSDLIKSGIGMPLKMALGGISEGHDEAIPLGPITHLKQEGNKILGMAALWDLERFQDVEIIKKYFEAEKPLNVSWEISYTKSKQNEDGVEDLLDPVLNAATLVGMPAYLGRTPILAVASLVQKLENNETLTEEEKQLVKKIGQSSMEEFKLDELKEQLRLANDRIKSLEEKLENAETKLQETEATLSEAQESVSSLEEENEDLKEFKETVKAEKAEIEKLNQIKEQFSEAGLDKDDEYFEENRKRLLSMDDEAVEFMIQELVSFASENDREDDGSNNSQASLPRFTKKGTGKVTHEDMLELLKSRHAKS